MATPTALTVVVRLRFAVALALAVAILLALGGRVALAQEPPVREYIVQMKDGATPAQGRKLAAKLGGQVTTPELPVINGFGAMLDDDAAAELARRRGVASVTPNSDLATGEDGASGSARCPGAAPRRRGNYKTGRGSGESNLERAIARLGQPLQAAIGADRAWSRGVTGRGVGVAVVDTGIAGHLPNFMNGRESRVAASVVTNPCATDADDHVGHGTHVAGLIAGNSLGAGGATAGRYMGIAPGASLISIKVSDDRGDTTVLDVIYGLQFVVDHRAELGIRVVNLSLSSTVAESYKTDPLAAAAEAAWFAGVVAVAAAGNDGSSSDAVSFAPGNDPYVITVGALDDNGTTERGDDRAASWSSHGVTQDGVRKPELLAPGYRLVAPLAPLSSFDKQCRSCTVGKSYFRLSGTSMAAAVVSGGAALMLEARPGLTPDQVKGALLATAREVRGAGTALDVYAALDGHGPANVSLVPSTLIDTTTGGIDWTRASFRRASFRDAIGSPFAALWTRASFRCDCGLNASGAVDPARASFRRVSFRRTFAFRR